MAGPDANPAEKAKVKPPVEYPDFDSDDESEDTVETRKSISQAEKYYKHRFFINAKDKRDYEEKLKTGNVDPAEANFEEKTGEEIGQDPKVKAEKLAVKKEKAAAKVEAEEKKAEEDKKPAKQKKEEAKAAEAAAKDAAAKAETPEEKAKAAATPAPAPPAGAAPFVPPELAGAMIQMY